MQSTGNVLTHTRETTPALLDPKNKKLIISNIQQAKIYCYFNYVSAVDVFIVVITLVIVVVDNDDAESVGAVVGLRIPWFESYTGQT